MDEYNSSKYDMNSFEFGMSNDRDTSGYFDQSCFDEVDSTNRSFSRSLHPENPYGPSKESLVNAPLHRMDQKLDSIFSFQMDTSYSQEQKFIDQDEQYFASESSRAMMNSSEMMNRSRSNNMIRPMLSSSVSSSRSPAALSRLEEIRALQSGQVNLMPSNPSMLNNSLPSRATQPSIARRVQPNNLASSRGLMMDNSPQVIDETVCQVQFKRKTRYFILGNPPCRVSLGDVVKVEADRGEDLGTVKSIMSFQTYLEIRRQMEYKIDHNKDEEASFELKKLFRLATPQEKMQLNSKFNEELLVIQYCRELAINVYALPLTIVDAEFQFDKKKLTVYYESARRVDFREFVRDLFAVYKTRIWMQQASPSDVIDSVGSDIYHCNSLPSTPVSMPVMGNVAHSTSSFSTNSSSRLTSVNVSNMNMNVGLNPPIAKASNGSNGPVMVGQNYSIASSNYNNLHSKNFSGNNNISSQPSRLGSIMPPSSSSSSSSMMDGNSFPTAINSTKVNYLLSQPQVLYGRKSN